MGTIQLDEVFLGQYLTISKVIFCKIKKKKIDRNNTGSDYSGPLLWEPYLGIQNHKATKIQMKNVEGSSLHTGTSILYSVRISFTHINLQKFLWFLILYNLFLQSTVSNFRNLGILSLTKESFFEVFLVSSKLSKRKQLLNFNV